MKHALNTDQRPSILMSCDELCKAIHEMRSEDIIQCWMSTAHQTIDELKGKSASSSLKSVSNLLLEKLRLTRVQPDVVL